MIASRVLKSRTSRVSLGRLAFLLFVMALCPVASMSAELRIGIIGDQRTQKTLTKLMALCGKA